jgi:membrane fusion protein (multidrug efflux system)
VEKAQLDLSHATVTAPIAGRAGRAQVTEGALVGEDDATWLTTVEQIDPLYVEFTVSVASWNMLRVLAAAQSPPEVKVRGSDGRLHEFPATLGFFDLAVDPGTGTIALRGSVPNPSRSLLPGMFVDLLVDIGSAEPVFRLPQTAVLRDEHGAYVFLLNAAGKVERRDIQLDGTVGSDWRVRTGFSAGEQLIVSGLQKLSPGASAKAAAPAPQG